MEPLRASVRRHKVDGMRDAFAKGMIHLIEGSRLLAPVLVAAAKAIPTSHLARMGLLRGPLVGFGPAFGAFVGGAAFVALLVPESRAWVTARANEAIGWAQAQWKAPRPEADLDPEVP